MIRSVLIIGAGELGLSLIQAFASHPSEPAVAVLLRPSSKADISSYPVRIVHGEILAPQPELARLLGGYDIVVSATGFAGGPGSQLHLANAALEAKVPHYFPWQFGVDYDTIGKGSSQPLFDEQLDVRALLRSQNATKWTIVSTGLFTSFLFDPSFGVVDLKNRVVSALGSWENSLTVTSAEAIGLLTSRIALDEEHPPEGVIFIASDTIKFEDVAHEVETKGWTVEKRVITIEELEDRLRRDPEDLGAKYGLIWARNVGVSWALEDTWNAKKGIKTERLSQWVDRNLPRP
ncbi:uncharacterized protein I303_106985 [Kwoniella dejecticola CBS 10117]|uniref:NmrA-like domain-containing protein n=1 Tax=Kwoniella dejecticola CBS 10117 TaxID=1296121 RepID=A0A1A5ZYD9_9TREE|nr:uncharacterized protein I303_06386 [Kwoniella dejecticola CBS 10117]OBR82829.1 hypothetical protein I303_06386 [Kwoniella dejecticola CBS 10117]